ncbi:MAG: SxtJ family membrane protein [Bacteroidota bacterium]
MKQMNRTKSLETCLVLTIGFMVLYFLKSRELFLYIAFGFGITGILIKPLAGLIAVGWFKLADIMGFLFSKVVLGVLFYVVLFPISVLYRLTKKDPLHIRHPKGSSWVERDHNYQGKDLENIW